MNAPDKIFIDKDCNFNEHDSFIAWSYEPPFASVEYIRKDVLLEWAESYKNAVIEQSKSFNGFAARASKAVLEDLIDKLNSM